MCRYYLGQYNSGQCPRQLARDVSEKKKANPLVLVWWESDGHNTRNTGEGGGARWGKTWALLTGYVRMVRMAFFLFFFSFLWKILFHCNTNGKGDEKITGEYHTQRYPWRYFSCQAFHCPCQKIGRNKITVLPLEPRGMGEGFNPTSVWQVNTI